MSVVSDFQARFGAEPDGVWSAPGRVNLIGEHTDYNGGTALPFAIDRRTRVALRLRRDGRIRIASSLFAGEVDSDLETVLGAGPLPGWSAYVLGTARILAAVHGADRASGFDAEFASDIPLGAGVSSSHALECATAVALRDAWGLEAGAADLIGLTRRVEHEVVGSPTGTLDQSAILLGRADCAVALDFAEQPRPPRVVPLRLAASGLALLVVDSTVKHEHSAAGGYRERAAETSRAAELLGGRKLGGLSPEELEAARPALGDVLFRRARHIVTETARVARIERLITAGEERAIGPVLTASHASQRDDYECSVPAVDAAVSAALEAGALGARLTGGGFGGSCIALVDAEAADGIAQTITGAVAGRGFPAPHVFPVLPDRGAGRDA